MRWLALAICLAGSLASRAAAATTTRPASRPVASTKPATAPARIAATPEIQQAQPWINYLFPAGCQRSATTQATVTGKDLQGVNDVRVNGSGVVAKIARVIPPTTQPVAPASVVLDISVAHDAAIGLRDIRLLSPAGASNRCRFSIGDLPEMMEKEPNSDRAHANLIPSLPITVNGQLMEGDRDYYRFAARAGQTLVFDVEGRALLPFIADAVPGWIDACLTLFDADGRQLATMDDFRFRPDPMLIWTAPKDGEYIVEIHDILFRGRGDFLYRLTIGQLPRITHIFPLGARRGTTAKVELFGANLPASRLELPIPQDCPPLREISILSGALHSNSVRFAAGDLPEILETERNDTPASAQKIAPPVIINGRIDRPGDVDCFAFAAEANQKLLFEVQARRLDSPLDSIVTLYNKAGAKLAENDNTVNPSEGLITHHADSRLIYTFTAKGEYLLRLRDVQGKGGPEYAYRLIVARPSRISRCASRRTIRASARATARRSRSAPCVKTALMATSRSPCPTCPKATSRATASSPGSSTRPRSPSPRHVTRPAASSRRPSSARRRWASRPSSAVRCRPKRPCRRSATRTSSPPASSCWRWRDRRFARWKATGRQ